MKFIILIPTLLITGCMVPSGYQSKLQLPDGSMIQSPKDGLLKNISVAKETFAKDGSHTTFTFHADEIQYGVNSNAVGGEIGVYRALLPNGIDGVVTATGNAVGQGVGAAAHTAVTGGAP